MTYGYMHGEPPTLSWDDQTMEIGANALDSAQRLVEVLDDPEVAHCVDPEQAATRLKVLLSDAIEASYAAKRQRRYDRFTISRLTTDLDEAEAKLANDQRASIEPAPPSLDPVENDEDAVWDSRHPGAFAY